MSRVKSQKSLGKSAFKRAPGSVAVTLTSNLTLNSYAFHVLTLQRINGLTRFMIGKPRGIRIVCGQLI
jgi:hypothetical protein